MLALLGGLVTVLGTAVKFLAGSQRWDAITHGVDQLPADTHPDGHPDGEFTPEELAEMDRLEGEAGPPARGTARRARGW